MSNGETTKCEGCKTARKAYDYLHGEYVALIKAVCDRDEDAMDKVRRECKVLEEILTKVTNPAKPWCAGDGMM